LPSKSLSLGALSSRVIGGAIHYPRVPRAYWRDRMVKLIDLGCNTLETYVFWNARTSRTAVSLTSKECWMWRHLSSWRASWICR
jgi:beta-galactosidase GanA